MAVADHSLAFAALKPVLARHAPSLLVKVNTPIDYTLVTKAASPFPQHKGQPMFFGSVREGKAYVSFHLMPLYMCPDLVSRISPTLKKRMQGKTCFNFRNAPAPELIEELEGLTEIAFRNWSTKGWL
jgi:hypothetical protein